MPMKTKIGTETAHITRDSDTTFKVKKVKGQGHQAALLSAALTCKAAAAVSVGTYSAWESTATLRLLGGARGVWAPSGEERGLLLYGSLVGSDSYPIDPWNVRGNIFWRISVHTLVPFDL